MIWSIWYPLFLAFSIAFLGAKWAAFLAWFFGLGLVISMIPNQWFAFVPEPWDEVVGRAFFVLIIIAYTAVVLTILSSMGIVH